MSLRNNGLYRNKDNFFGVWDAKNRQMMCWHEGKFQCVSFTDFAGQAQGVYGIDVPLYEENPVDSLKTWHIESYKSWINAIQKCYMLDVPFDKISLPQLRYDLPILTALGVLIIGLLLLRG